MRGSRLPVGNHVSRCCFSFPSAQSPAGIASPRGLRAVDLQRSEPVDLALGQHLHQPGSTQDHFYFPGTSIVSLIGVLRNGDATELSLVGCEGGVGVGLILGGETTLTRATVQSAGTALRWKAASLEARAQTRWRRPAHAPSLRAGRVDPDRAIRAVQPASHAPAAALQVAAPQPRSRR